MNTIAFVAGAAVLGLCIPGIIKGIVDNGMKLQIPQCIACAIGCALLAYGVRG